MKYIIHIVLFILFSSLANAQQYYIRGEVQDEKANPLQNVSILQQCTGYIFYSGSGGAFGITSTKKLDTLTFSFAGYKTVKLPVNASEYVKIKLQRSPASSAHASKLSSFTNNLKRDVQQQWFVGDETYASLVENRFISADKYPVTGLKLNVDRASYSNIRRFLNMNTTVPPDAVRTEEMLNYFNFNYTEPPDKKTFDIQAMLTACPWNEERQLLLAKITSKKIDLDTLPPTQLVFLIDISGSMDMPNRLPILKAGFCSLVKNLRAKDSISLVVYGGTTGVLLDAVSGEHKDSIQKVIDGLEPGGYTPGESGIKMAYSLAKSHFIKGGNNRVILATDGDFNVGLKRDEDLEDMIVKQKESGIYLTCLGVGMGNYKDSKIQTLAQKGNGNFAYIDNYAEAEKVLLQEFMQTLYTVADDTYLNVQFNPDVVKEYRVVGFDNKVGAIKDTLATLEGGAIGPAYSLLIAFEIIPTDSNMNLVKTNGILQPATFHLSYKEPDTKKSCELSESPQLKFTPFDHLDKCYQFAGSVIMFGLLLRNSDFAKDASWNDVLETATTAADNNNIQQKEFITLVQQAKKIYGKRKRHS